MCSTARYKANKTSTESFVVFFFHFIFFSVVQVPLTFLITTSFPDIPQSGIHIWQCIKVTAVFKNTTFHLDFIGFSFIV